jgi:hypothetical protein
MNDLKTTFAGLVTAVVALAASFNILIDPRWTTAILAVGAGVIGFFAKDGTNNA